jgi:hypothetical protein
VQLTRILISPNQSISLCTTSNTFHILRLPLENTQPHKMSEVQARPSAPRGRGSARGGRAGFGSRGGRGGRGHATNGDRAENIQPASIEDDGEVAQLKKQYGSKVSTIKEMFPDWTDEDAVSALQETNGDLETTVERITDGKTLQ